MYLMNQCSVPGKHCSTLSLLCCRLYGTGKGVCTCSLCAGVPPGGAT